MCVGLSQTLFKGDTLYDKEKYLSFINFRYIHFNLVLKFDLYLVCCIRSGGHFYKRFKKSNYLKGGFLMFKKLLSNKVSSNPTISFQNGKDAITFSTTLESYECIKKYLEHRTDKHLISRLELANLIEGNLDENALNNDVQIHMMKIMPDLINLAFQHNQYAFIFKQDVLTDLGRSDDLQQAVFSITQSEYYYALTHVLNYLLRHKDPQEPLSFMEVYLVYILINSILFNTAEQSNPV